MNGLEQDVDKVFSLTVSLNPTSEISDKGKTVCVQQVAITIDFF